MLFLTCDAFGVLPPLSRLTPEQALYHFLSGYTAKVAGTERGVTEPEATFSTCFAAPFLPLPPVRYAELLRARLLAHGPPVWLVNTGWTGGGARRGQRIPLAYTSGVGRAALSGALSRRAYTTGPDLWGGVPRALSRRAGGTAPAPAPPGRTRPNTMPRPAAWRASSRPTISSTRPRCRKACARRDRRCEGFGFLLAEHPLKRRFSHVSEHETDPGRARSWLVVFRLAPLRPDNSCPLPGNRLEWR